MPSPCSAFNPKQIKTFHREATNPLSTSESEPQPSAPVRKPYSVERLLVGFLATIVVLMVNIPWLLGCLISQPGKRFIGTAYNIVDFENYLAWLQQTSHGQIILRNLFTTLPQNPKQINLLFIILGQLVHITGMAPAALYQSVRLFAGIGLLALLWRFIRYCFPARMEARLASFYFLCFGNGLGWLTAHKWADTSPSNSPIEAWQPEAYTFQSLETSTLFCISTAFILASMAFLTIAENKKQMRFAVYAGLCLAALGNMHSYDILHVAAAWSLFLVVRTIMLRNKEVLQSWLRAIVALVIMLPTALYEFYAFRTDPIFHARADVKTLAVKFHFYLAGYAPMLVLGAVYLTVAITAFILNRKHRETPKMDEPSFPFHTPVTALVTVCWAIAGLAICYVAVPKLNLHTSHPWFPVAWTPVAFQRKMLMGEHIPLCLLAGAGTSSCVRYLRGWVGWIPFLVLFSVSVPSAFYFTNRDIRHVLLNRSEIAGYFPYLDQDTDDSLNWISHNTTTQDAILGLPTFSGIVPAETGRTVWSGHWAETPDFSETVGMFNKFVSTDTPDYAREAFLTHAKTDYLWIPNASILNGAPGRAATDFSENTPPYLTLVHSNPTFLIYRVNTDKLTLDSPPTAQAP